MRLQVDGVDLPYKALFLNEDLNSYYSTIVFYTSFFPHSKNVKFISDKTFDLVILRSTFENNSEYKNIAVSAETFKALNTVCEPYTGIADVKKLISTHLGFKFYSETGTIPTFWSLPKMKLISIIQVLNKYAKVGNGGGAHFYVDLYGNIKFVDYKFNFKNATVNKMYATVLSDKSTMDWIMKVPGEVDIYHHSLKGVSYENFVIEKDYGKGSIIINDLNENLLEVRKQMLVNDFYNNFFNSRQVEVTEPLIGSLVLGDVYTIDDIGKFILSSYSIENNTGTDNSTNLKIKLVTCPR